MKRSVIIIFHFHLIFSFRFQRADKFFLSYAISQSAARSSFPREGTASKGLVYLIFFSVSTPPSPAFYYVKRDSCFDARFFSFYIFNALYLNFCECYLTQRYCQYFVKNAFIISKTIWLLIFFSFISLILMNLI